MSISKQLRYQILRRDNHACRYCGATAPDAKIVIDHVVPKTLGGSDSPENLVAACATCNAGKSATPPDANHIRDVEQDAVRWSRAMTTAQQMQMAERERVLDYVDMVDAAWAKWTYPNGDVVARPVGWQTSAENFYRWDINLSDWRMAIRKAMTNERVPHEDTWRYMCGVLWNLLRDRTDIAKSILAEDGE